MDSVIDMEEARRLVSDAALWPRVRDFLWDFGPQIHPSRLPAGLTTLVGQSPRVKRFVLDALGVTPVFHDFPQSDNSRLLLLPSDMLVGLAKWLGALSCAAALRRIMDGAKVRALKSALPDVYPAVFSYTAYFRDLEGQEPSRFDGLSGDDIVKGVVNTGYDIVFSFLSSLPDGLVNRLLLKLPDDVVLPQPSNGQTVKPSNLQKILKLKFPEAYALCCS